MSYLVLCAPIFGTVYIDDKICKTKQEAISYVRDEISKITTPRIRTIYAPRASTSEQVDVVYEAHIFDADNGVLAVVSIYYCDEHSRF